MTGFELFLCLMYFGSMTILSIITMYEFGVKKASGAKTRREAIIFAGLIFAPMVNTVAVATIAWLYLEDRSNLIHNWLNQPLKKNEQ